MRLVLLVAVGSILAGAPSQANPLVIAHATLANPIGTTGLAYTPTMQQRDADRRARGLAYLATNARTEDDVRELAQKCHKTSAVPAYCAIPEMRQIAYRRGALN